MVVLLIRSVVTLVICEREAEQVSGKGIFALTVAELALNKTHFYP